MEDLTADHARAFMRAINTARGATGLDPVEKITLREYRDMSPGSPHTCLSATLLAMPLGGSTQTQSMTLPSEHGEAVAEAWGTRLTGRSVDVHRDVMRVTDRFDSLDGDFTHGTGDDPVLAAFTEAGLIDTEDAA